MSAYRIDRSQAVELYNSGLSIEAIARDLGITRQALWVSLKRRGVKFRSNVKSGQENHFYRGGSKRNTSFIMIDAVRKGVLCVGPCEICGLTPLVINGKQRIHGHHDDYNKPLEVRWLCKEHHHEWHKRNEAKPRTTPRMEHEVIASMGGKSSWLKHRNKLLAILAKNRAKRWSDYRSKLNNKTHK